MNLIDAWVFIYAGGRDHPLRMVCLNLYQRILTDPTGFIIDTEVLQEILHLYHSRKETRRGTTTVNALLQLFPSPIPITAAEISTASAILVAHPRLSARDAIHAAVVQVHGLEAIVSLDRDFDDLAGIRRLTPADLGIW